MSQLHKLATAVGTFAVALGIGFVMQNGDALASRMGGDEAASASDAAALARPMAIPVASAASTPQMAAPRASHPIAAAASMASPPLGMLIAALPNVAPVLGRGAGPDVTTASATAEAIQPEPDLSVAFAMPEEMAVPVLPVPPVQLAAIETDDMLADLPALEDAGPDCTIGFEGTANTAAMVDLTLRAACAPGAIATIHHQGMMFSLPLSEDGTARISVPALTEGAVFIADIEGGDGAVAVVSVPDVAMYDRAVLQWQGETGLQLHALEFGAGYQDDGHLWNASHGSADTVMQGESGFMVRLGSEGGLVAEVYSYPTGYSVRSGEVVLSVEAEVTEANCNREIAAQSMQFHPGAEPTALDLVMTLPECDAVGEFLILNTMLENLTLTSR